MEASTLHASLISLAGGAYYGLNAGMVSGLSKPMILCEFFPVEPLVNEPNNTQATYNGILVSSILFGAMIGSYLGVPLAHKYGRVRAFQIAGLMALSIIGLYFAPTFWSFVAMRFVAGFPIGMVCTLCPLYVQEVVRPDIRGAVGTMMQVAIAGCLFVAMLVNYVAFTTYDPDSTDPDLFCVPHQNARVQLALGVVPAICITVHSFFFLPESTVWIEKNGPNSPLISARTDVEEGYDEDDEIIEEESRAHYELLSDEPDVEIHLKPISWKDFFLTKEGLKNAFIGVGLGVATMLTGMDCNIFYGPQIIKDAGFGNVTLVTALVIGLWNFLCVFIATVLVDKLGRRPLMIAAMFAMTLGTATLFMAYTFIVDNETIKGLVALCGVMVFIIGFEVGPGSLFWLLASETFSDRIRPRALVFTNMIQWIANIAVAFCFPIMNAALGPSKTYLILTVICVLSALFCTVVLPEPKSA